MYCMKCGREVEEGQVFCESCLENMKKYPVKPGIAVQLPQHRDQPIQKKMVNRRRQGISPEEQILRLKKRGRRLFFLWLITLLLLTATIYPTVEFYLGKTFYQPGQNYSTVVTETQPRQTPRNQLS